MIAERFDEFALKTVMDQTRKVFQWQRTQSMRIVEHGHSFRPDLLLGIVYLAAKGYALLRVLTQVHRLTGANHPDVRIAKAS